MGDIKKLINDTLDLLSNMTVRDAVSENLRFMHHYKFVRMYDDPARAALNKTSCLLTKILHTIKKMLGTLKVHTYQKLIDSLHKLMSVLELIPYYIEEMTQVDYYITSENEMYDQILNYWYKALKEFDVNNDFNNKFWTSQDVFDLFKEMRSMVNLQNFQVEFK